jgi:hypothetical protein
MDICCGYIYESVEALISEDIKDLDLPLAFLARGFISLVYFFAPFFDYLPLFFLF